MRHYIVKSSLTDSSQLGLRSQAAQVLGTIEFDPSWPVEYLIRSLHKRGFINTAQAYVMEYKNTISVMSLQENELLQLELCNP